MNAMTFLVGINEIDDRFLTEVLELPDTGQAEPAGTKGVLQLSKMILIAAILAGLLGITAWAAGGFDGLFQRIAEKGDGWGYGMDDVFRNAAEVVPPVQPETHPLQDDDSSVISIGQTYYDGDTFMIAYRFDDSVPADLTFGEKKEDFDSFYPTLPPAEEVEETAQAKLRNDMEARQVYREPMERYGQEYLELGLMTQEQYDAMLASLDEESYVYCTYMDMLFTDHDILHKELSPEEYATYHERLLKDGHAGVAIREYYIGDGLYFEDGERLKPDENGIVVDIHPTEDGDCLYGPPMLPEKYRNLENLTLTFRVVYYDKCIYMDMENGVRRGGREVGEERVTVTIPRSEKKS